MAGETEDLEIVIDAEGAPTEPGAEIKADPAPADPPKPDGEVEAAEGIEALKRNLDAANSMADQEKRGRLDAERRAREATRAADQAKAETHDTGIAMVEATLATVNTTADMLESRYAEAAANGDWASAGKIQREMAGNEAKRFALEQAKATMEQAPKPAAKRDEPAITDPVEHLASQLTPRSAAWVRAHPEYAHDQRKYAMMLAAHNLAVERDGAAVDTDGYFASVEATLGLGQPAEQDGALSDASKTTQRRQAPAPAAPPSRNGTADGRRPNTVTLSPEEVEMAESMGMTTQEYAKNKLALQREGKLTTH